MTRNTEKELDLDFVAKILKLALDGKNRSSSSNKENDGFVDHSNDALKYGARGIDRSQQTPEQKALSEEGISLGVPESEAGDFQRNPNSYRSIPRVRKGDGASIANKYGLQGFNLEGTFEGMTVSDANKRAQELVEQKQKNVTAGTSGAYNPETIAGTKRKFDVLRTKLDDINNTPWETNQTKKNVQESTINAFTKDLSNLFGTQEEYKAAQQNPEFQGYMDQLTSLGGSPAGVEAGIKTPQFNNDMAGPQGLGDYIKANSEAQKQALESLIPETKAAQDEIAFEQSIPDRYMEYYFGTEEEVGRQQQLVNEADEAIKLIERRQKQDEKNARNEAENIQERYNFEQKKAGAEIEKNRLAAKNFMTERLASLGALKTSGKAPAALATLEQKYQEQLSSTNREYDFARTDLNQQLDAQLAELDISRDEDILSIRQNLSSSDDDAWREIYKAQEKADRASFDVINSFNTKFRTQTDKYRKELEKKAKEYTDSFASVVGANDLSEGDFFKGGNQEGVVNPFGEIIPLDLTPSEQKLVEGAGIRGEQGIRTFLTYPSAFKNWYVRQVQRGSITGSGSDIEDEYNDWKLSNTETGNDTSLLDLVESAFPSDNV